MTYNVLFLCRSIIYIEGNLEQKVFNDPMTGLVRRIREIAIRSNGTCIAFFQFVY